MSPIAIVVSMLITNVLMQVGKKLSGLRRTDNGSSAYLNGLLALFAILSSLAASYFTGNELDPNQISEWASAVVVAAITFYGSSGIYEKVLKRMVR